MNKAINETPAIPVEARSRIGTTSIESIQTRKLAMGFVSLSRNFTKLQLKYLNLEKKLEECKIDHKTHIDNLTKKIKDLTLHKLDVDKFMESFDELDVSTNEDESKNKNNLDNRMLIDNLDSDEDEITLN